jgi:hypothetical protein
MHATTTNTTCSCQPSACSGGVKAVRTTVRVTTAGVEKTPQVQESGAVSNATSPPRGTRKGAREGVGDSGVVPAAPAPPSATTTMLVIGDSISLGMQNQLAALMAADGWALHHSPGNGDNSNYGAHCLPSWVPLATETPLSARALSSPKLSKELEQPPTLSVAHPHPPPRSPSPPPLPGMYDVISFQFGLHDIAYDEERLTVAQYTEQLTNITAHLVAVQQRCAIIWSLCAYVQQLSLIVSSRRCNQSPHPFVSVSLCFQRAVRPFGARARTPVRVYHSCARKGMSRDVAANWQSVRSCAPPLLCNCTPTSHIFRPISHLPWL